MTELRRVNQAGSLAIIGGRGAVSWGDHGAIVYHAREDRGGWQHNPDCWLVSGGCWSDPGATADKYRATAAYADGGTTGVYGVLEELYRQEFES